MHVVKPVLMCVHHAHNHYHSDGGGTISEHIETPSDSKVLLNYVFFTYHYNFKNCTLDMQS